MPYCLYTPVVPVQRLFPLVMQKSRRDQSHFDIWLSVSGTHCTGTLSQTINSYISRLLAHHFWCLLGPVTSTCFQSCVLNYPSIHLLVANPEAVKFCRYLKISIHLCWVLPQGVALIMSWDKSQNIVFSKENQNVALNPE